MAKTISHKRQKFSVEDGIFDETTPFIVDGLITHFPLIGTTDGISDNSNLSSTEVDWVVGTSGSQGSFSQNGSTSENEIILKDNPWGVEKAVWTTESNDLDSGSDGGFNSSLVPIDNKKTYRLSVWIKRENVGDGRTYFGLRSNTDGVLTLDGTIDNNAYFYTTLITNLPELENQWVLFVYYIHNKDYISTESSTDSGVYLVDGTHIATGKDYKWSLTATDGGIRSYLFYSTSIDERQYWYDPRMEIYDETSATIEDLISGSPNKYYPSIDTDVALTPCGVGIGEPITNIISNPTGNNGAESHPSTTWDSELHNDALTVDSWNDGHNTGVPVETTGYHAKWVYEGHDGGACQKHMDFNTFTGYPHRWLGISYNITTDMSSIGWINGTEVTISWLQKVSTIGKYGQIGIHHTQSSVSTFTGAQWNTYNTKPNTWERILKTFVVPSNWDTDTFLRIYCYGMYGDEGIIWFDDFQMTVGGNMNIPFVDGARASNSSLVIPMKDVVDTYTIIGQFMPYTPFDGTYDTTLDNSNLFTIKDTVSNGEFSYRYYSNGLSLPHLHLIGSFDDGSEWAGNSHREYTIDKDEMLWYAVTKIGINLTFKIFQNEWKEVHEVTINSGTILSNITFGDGVIWNGTHSNISIYDRVLTDSEINSMVGTEYKLLPNGNILTNISENTYTNLWTNANFETTNYGHSTSDLITLETDELGTYHQRVMDGQYTIWAGYTNLEDPSGCIKGDVYIISAWVWVSSGHSGSNIPLFYISGGENTSRNYTRWDDVPTDEWVYWSAESTIKENSSPLSVYVYTSSDTPAYGTIKWRNVIVRKKSSTETKLLKRTLYGQEFGEN